jgi:membrane protease YdiL (CAAX protease family)
MKTKTWLQKYSLVGYFLLAYAFTWSIGIPLALIALGKLDWNLHFSLHYLAAFGPMLSALIMEGLTNGRQGIGSLLKRLLKWRMHPGWWLMAISPLIGYTLIAFLQGIVRKTWANLSLLGEINFLPNVGFGALLIWIFTFGLGEETGWRGFALPRLQEKYSALSATLILGALWAFWHFPFFFYILDPTIVVGWLFGLMTGAIMLTWFYNSTGGNLLAVVIWHGAFNFITASKAGEGLAAAIISTLIMVWAIVLVFVYKPANLSPRPKQTSSNKDL